MCILSHEELRAAVRRDFSQREIKLETISVSQFRSMSKLPTDNFILSHDAQMKAIGKHLSNVSDGINISVYFTDDSIERHFGWMPLTRIDQVESTFNYWSENDCYRFGHYYFVELDETFSPIGIEELI